MRRLLYISIALSLLSGCSTTVKGHLTLVEISKTSKQEAFRAQSKFKGFPLTTSGIMDSELFGNTFYKLTFASSVNLHKKYGTSVFFTGHSLRGCKSKRNITSLNILDEDEFAKLYAIYFPKKEISQDGFYDLTQHPEDLCFQITQNSMKGQLLTTNVLVVNREQLR